MAMVADKGGWGGGGDDNIKNRRLLNILFSMIKTDSWHQYYIRMESSSWPARNEVSALIYRIQEKSFLVGKVCFQGRKGGGGVRKPVFLACFAIFWFLPCPPHISLSAGYRDKKKDSKMEDLFTRQRT
jgi:hypothetical protein